MKRALAEIARQPATCVAVLLIAAVVFAAIAAPWLAPFSPDAQPFDGLSLEGAPLPPGSKYWLGTDTLGRDLLSRLLFGARTSLVIGLVANGVAVMIGMIVGVVAGYVSGFVGNALMRFTDLMMAFPALLLAIVLAALLRPSLWIVALVIALVNWVQVARIIYTETRGLVERDFILAERSLGAGHMRILFRHIAPHLLPSAIVWGTLGVATTVLWRRRSPSSASACSRRSPPGATSSTRARATFRPRRGSCSSPARSFSRRRFPSILSATPCATCSTRPSGDAADGGAAGSTAHAGGRRSAWRRGHHLPASALSARRSGGARRRPQRQRANDRQRSPSAWPRSASALAVLALSDRPRARRPWTLLYPAQRSRDARHGAHSGDPHVDGLRHSRRGRAGAYARRHRSRAAQRLRRSHGDDVRFRRRVVAAVRGRAVAALCLRRPPWLVSDERLRHAGPRRSAGADARLARRRMVRADGAFGDDRRPQSGLRAHGSRQGPEPARASFCGTPCRTRFCPSSR